MPAELAYPAILARRCFFDDADTNETDRVSFKLKDSPSIRDHSRLEPIALCSAARRA
jgi:hypothetical protein